MKKTPLIINNPGDKHEESYYLNGPFLVTYEKCLFNSQELQHAMVAPGYFEHNHWSLADVYSPDLRPLHRHDAIEIIYVMQGEMTQYIEDFQQVYTAGECCILGKSIRHVESFSSDFEAYFLLLSEQFILDSMNNNHYYGPNLNKHNYQLSIYKELLHLMKEETSYQKQYIDLLPAQDSTDIRDSITHIFQTMTTESKYQYAGFYAIIAGYLARFFSILSDSNYYQLQHKILKTSNEYYIFNRITIYLEKNNGNIDFDELQTLMHYTKDYLNRIVKRISGMTLTEYGQKICLEKAAYLLSNTDKSISQIIQELNYTNRTYFYRIFYEKYETTPAEYRKNNKVKSPKG